MFRHAAHTVAASICRSGRFSHRPKVRLADTGATRADAGYGRHLIPDVATPGSCYRPMTVAGRSSPGVPIGATRANVWRKAALQCGYCRSLASGDLATVCPAAAERAPLHDLGCIIITLGRSKAPDQGSGNATGQLSNVPLNHDSPNCFLYQTNQEPADAVMEAMERWNGRLFHLDVQSSGEMTTP